MAGPDTIPFVSWCVITGAMMVVSGLSYRAWRRRK